MIKTDFVGKITTRGKDKIIRIPKSIQDRDFKEEFEHNQHIWVTLDIDVPTSDSIEHEIENKLKLGEIEASLNLERQRRKDLSEIRVIDDGGNTTLD